MRDWRRHGITCAQLDHNEQRPGYTAERFDETWPDATAEQRAEFMRGYRSVR